MDIGYIETVIQTIIDNDAFHQDKPAVSLRIENEQLFAMFTFPYAPPFQEIISLSSVIAQDRTTLIAYLSYKAGMTIEWRSTKNKMKDLTKSIMRSFLLDRNDL